MSEDNNYTDSTNLTIKDLDKKKLFFNEEEINYINTINGENQNEKKEFKEPDHELNWKYINQYTYHFKQDIERVWLILRSFDFLSLIANQGHYPCIFIKGKSTWKIGNIFEGNIYGKYHFIAKVQNCINLPEIKKVKWLFHIRENDYFIIKLELFKVTGDNSTVVLKKVKYEKFELDLDIKNNIKKSYEIRIFQQVEQLLEKEPINLLKYESGIISGKMEDIWDLVLDFNKLTIIAPNNNYVPSINVKDLKIGEKQKTSIFCNNQIRKLDFTLKCREEKPGWNKWLIVCEASGGQPVKIPKHTVVLQLTKINEYECQLTLLTKYHESIDNNEFKELSNRKKYIILSVKEYFEKFYCPSESC